jgi:hypothetical protein
LFERALSQEPISGVMKSKEAPAALFEKKLKLKLKRQQ